MKTKTNPHRILALLLCICPVAGSVQTRPFQTVGRAVIYGNVSYDQARIYALNQARALAVEQAGGISVDDMSIYDRELLVSDFIKTFIRGFIVDESSLTWKGSWSENNGRKPPFPVLEVTLKGQVDVRQRSFFRPNMFTASLNQKTFHSGEHAIVNIDSHADLYLLIANYTSQGKIVPIFPNTYHRDNFLEKGRQLSVPVKDGVHPPIVISTFPGHERDTEAFIVIGIPKNSKTKNITWNNLFPAEVPVTYPDFFKRLLTQPLDWISNQIIVYTVNNK